MTAANRRVPNNASNTSARSTVSGQKPQSVILVTPTTHPPFAIFLLPLHHLRPQRLKQKHAVVRVLKQLRRRPQLARLLLSIPSIVVARSRSPSDHSGV